MCGVAGAIDRNADRATGRVTMLNAAQEHRGPDHRVVTRVGGFTLGNTRLAIQEPTPAGNQPFVSPDGRYHCVFNGEIYNHRLLTKRYRLAVRTSCDGEVIPALWAKLGVAALSELRGMFAIALADTLEERLYLARDPFGIKPLYWRNLSDGSLIFASEVRPLSRFAPGALIDPAAIARYLHLGAVAADRSPFVGISVVPPNSVAVFGLDGQAVIEPICPAGPFAASGAPADFGTALTDSISLHLNADVPTALLLSGGVDSATVAAVSRRLGQDLDCLTVATPGADDESGTAARTARHYGHRFHRVPAALENVDLARFFAAMQRPSIDGLNTYIISRAVHDAGFKVALSGLGGDEAVGGYSHFRLLRYLPALKILRAAPGPLASAAAKAVSQLGLAGEAKARRLLGRDGPRDGTGLCLLQRELLPAHLASGLTGIPAHRLASAQGLVCPPGPVSGMIAAEVGTYLQAMLLQDADAFSMASSVELRVPFVDGHVFSAALRLAAAHGRQPGKAAMGEALADSYLAGLAAQPKRGFSLPMRTWLTGPLAPVLRAADPPDAAVWSVVDRELAERAGLVPVLARDRWAEAWALAALNAWLATSIRQVEGL